MRQAPVNPGFSGQTVSGSLAEPVGSSSAAIGVLAGNSVPEPHGSASLSEIGELMKGLAAATTVLAQNAVDNSKRGSEGRNALAGLEFKQSMPVLRDKDYDFDGHWRQFESILDCHAF